MERHGQKGHEILEHQGPTDHWPGEMEVSLQTPLHRTGTCRRKVGKVRQFIMSNDKTIKHLLVQNLNFSLQSVNNRKCLNVNFLFPYSHKQHCIFIQTYTTTIVITLYSVDTLVEKMLCLNKQAAKLNTNKLWKKTIRYYYKRCKHPNNASVSTEPCPASIWICICVLSQHT